MTTAYMHNLELFLAEIDTFQASLEQLHGKCTERLSDERETAEERQRLVNRTSLFEANGLAWTGGPKVGGLALSDAIVVVLELFTNLGVCVLDAHQITANVRAFGYEFPRTRNPKGSVNAALSRLVSEERVGRTAPGCYSLPSERPPTVEVPLTAEVLVERHWDEIVREIAAGQGPPGFLGLKKFRDERLPSILETSDQSTVFDAMKLLTSPSGPAEVRYVPNPANPAHDTAAIRLKVGPP